MGRYSQAYSDLILRLDEVKRIVAVAKKIEAKGTLSSDFALTSALCRGGIVLLSSHIEGYISDLNEIIFHRLVERRISIKTLSPSFCYYLSRDILAEILDTSAPEK